MTKSSVEKQHAIAVHTEQSHQFEASYRSLASNPYADCFAYSRHRLHGLLGRLLPARAEGLRLLDIGCGTGHQLADLRARGFHGSGVDGSPAMLELARRNNPGVELKLGDVEQLSFDDASFDVAVCIEVLRYLRSPDACLREACRVLRPDGQLFVTALPLWNANGFLFVNRLATVVPIASLVRLRQFFITAGRLRAALTDAGFSDVEIHAVYGGPINWIERLAPRRLPQFLRWWERRDARVCERPLLRDLSNMFLAVARKAA